MRKLFAALIFSLFLFGNAQAQAPQVLFDTVISGLSQAIQVVHAGDGSGRLFIVQKTGGIRVYSKSYAFLGTFLTLPADSLMSQNEEGLLSMAFHPDYKNNGLFYIYYTNRYSNLRIDRYRVSSNNENLADVSSKVIFDTIPHPGRTNHNGGELHFGKDGYLYLSTGDGGGTGDPPNNAQNTSVFLGKILRYAVNTSNQPPYYTIPDDNPFGNKVYAYGLRNPFRWSFDRLTGDMWIGDVGQELYEEINFRPADSTKGVNYGWRCYEGLQTYNTSSGCNSPLNSYTFPIYTFPTNLAQAIAITGGHVYRGNTYINLEGWHIAAEYYTGYIIKVKYNEAQNKWDTATQKTNFTGIADFSENEDGELFAVSLNNGRVVRIISNGPIRYTFTGDGNWSVAANWYNNRVPPALLPTGSEIVINPVPGGECVLNTAQAISPGASLIVKDEKQFRILGNLDIQ
jgi:glucose/arabinose dehydrogenase